ncbi:hypothetical protein OAA23_00770 [bacterium]|jgi:cell fate (sporulation/competence/biofilm development) regulator YlbF (YheA/YmcA/DUF963 family)|nr:hypothetical protein [bacterium]
MKLKVTGLKREMSTTGTGASFTPGTGAQYASPKAFKKKTDEIGEPFEIPNPSIPNRKSKFIDYKQLFEDAIDELSEKKQFNPITDLTNSQADAGLNTGYDMDTQDAASVLEVEVGDTKTSKGVKYTVTDIDPQTGKISWDIDYVPAFDSVYKEFDDLRKVIAQLDQKTDDKVVDDIAAKIKSEFNRYRTHIRKNYPEAYKKFTINEARYSQFKKKSQFRTPTQQLHSAVREIRRKIDEMSKVVAFTERMRTELKASNEGMSYLNRTRNAITKINEKLQELNNRIKGLTE